MNNPHLLVIDDDDGILDAFKLMLSEAGYSVMTLLKDGELLAEAVNNQRPDLIILDMLLSGKDGRDLCRQLKASAKTKDIPVLMISAHPDAETSSLEAGADAFLAKPFEIESVLNKIKQLLT